MKKNVIFLLIFYLFLSCTSKENKRAVFFEEVSQVLDVKTKENSLMSHIILAYKHPFYDHFIQHIDSVVLNICEENHIKALFVVQGDLSDLHFKKLQNHPYCTFKWLSQKDTSEHTQFIAASLKIYQTIHYVCMKDHLDSSRQLYPEEIDKKEFLRLAKIDKIEDDLENFRYYWEKHIVSLNRDAIDVNVGDYDIVIFVVGGVHGYFLHENFNLPIVWSKSFEDQRVSDLLNIQLIVAQWLDLKGFGRYRLKKKLANQQASFFLL